MQVSLPRDMQDLIFSHTKLNTSDSEWPPKSVDSWDAKYQARDILNLALICKEFYQQLQPTLSELNFSYNRARRREKDNRYGARRGNQEYIAKEAVSIPKLAKVSKLDVEKALARDWSSVKSLNVPMLTCRQEYLNEFPAWQDRSGF